MALKNWNSKELISNISTSLWWITYIIYFSFIPDKCYNDEQYIDPSAMNFLMQNHNAIPIGFQRYLIIKMIIVIMENTCKREQTNYLHKPACPSTTSELHTASTTPVGVSFCNCTLHLRSPAGPSVSYSIPLSRNSCCNWPGSLSRR